MLGVDENDDLINPMMVKENRDEKQSFPQMILDNLKTAGVQQSNKSGKIDFIALTPWPGQYVGAEGTFEVDEVVASDERRVANEDSKTQTTNHKSQSTSPATSHKSLTTKRQRSSSAPISVRSNAKTLS